MRWIITLRCKKQWRKIQRRKKTHQASGQNRTDSQTVLKRALVYDAQTYVSLQHTEGHLSQYPGPEIIKLFSCSTQLSMKVILLINVKMPTIVGILTFISMINTRSERLKARNFFICWYFSFL